MLSTTLDVIRSALRADPTVTPPDRTRLIALLRNGNAAPPSTTHAKPPGLLRRAEVAQRLGCKLRAVDLLAQQGALVKLKFPGRRRANGITETSVNDLLQGRTTTVFSNECGE